MTIGEHYNGQGINVDDFIYLFIGNGIGSGLFLNGKFFKGFHSASGEIGHMMIGNEFGLKEGSGVFEKNYGLLGVREKLKKLNVDTGNVDSASLLEYLQWNRSHGNIEKILTETIEQWAKASVNIISIIDPEMVILSGELANMDQSSFHQFKAMIDKYVPQQPELKVTELGSRAGIYGAFHLALNYFHVAGFGQNKKDVYMEEI